MDKKMEDVEEGDVVRGLSQGSQSIINIVVERVSRFEGYLTGVSGRRVTDEGTIADRHKHYISLGLPGAQDGVTYLEDYATGERTTGGWTYPGIVAAKLTRRDKWAGPINELAVGATWDVDCTTREVATVRNVASLQGAYYLRHYKVEKTLTGCAVTRTR